MKLKEECLKKNEVFRCKVFTIYQDEVKLPNGEITERDVVDHKGGVCIAAQKDNGKFIMVEQYRYALNQNLIEFVAGKKEENEDKLITAKRELVEESGYSAKTWQYLGYFVPTCGYDNEIIDLYFAKDLEFVGQKLDDTEFLETFDMSLEEIMSKIEDGTIIDGKTIILAYKLKEVLK